MGIFLLTILILLVKCTEILVIIISHSLIFLHVHVIIAALSNSFGHVCLSKKMRRSIN